MTDAHATLMDPMGYLRFVLALGAVLALIGLCGYLLRRFGPGLGPRVAIGAKRRLVIIEALPLDARHRLVLLRRDGVEHLVVLSNDHSLLVESNVASMSPENSAVLQGTP